MQSLIFLYTRPTNILIFAAGSFFFCTFSIIPFFFSSFLFVNIERKSNLLFFYYLGCFYPTDRQTDRQTHIYVYIIYTVLLYTYALYRCACIYIYIYIYIYDFFVFGEGLAITALSIKKRPL
ncbi:hypothetical protein CLU79DRAFT_117492 [Phycomyces nitens]|nr:hypothetical protein CLU79DRAFT_117492 [Phycomyces nitens]